MIGIVYGIQSGQFIKVGATNNLQRRLHAFRLYNPLPMKVVLRREVKENYWVENRMHKILAQYAIGREWFDCTLGLVREAFETAFKEIAANRLITNGHRIFATPKGWKKVSISQQSEPRP